MDTTYLTRVSRACEAFLSEVSRKYNVPLERIRATAFSSLVFLPTSPVEVVFDDLSPGRPARLPVVASLPSLPPSAPAPEAKLTKKQQAVLQLVESAKEYVELKPSLSLSLVKLKEMCKARQLPVSGTKAQLIERLETGKVVKRTGDTGTAGKATGKGTGKTGTRKKKTQFKPRDVKAIIEKLQGATSKLGIRKNDHGYYVHPPTGLVFDPNTLRVSGRWESDKTRVRHLNSADVEVCISMGLKYDLPENLDYGIVKVVDKVLEEQLNEEDYKNGGDDDIDDGDDVDSDDGNGEEY